MVEGRANRQLGGAQREARGRGPVAPLERQPRLHGHAIVVRDQHVGRCGRDELLRGVDRAARGIVASFLQERVDHVIERVQPLGCDGLVMGARVLEAGLEGALVGGDRLVPQAEADKDVRGHVLRVRCRRCDLRISARRVEAEGREPRGIVRVNDVVREPGMLGESPVQRIQDRGCLLLAREGGVGLRRRLD